MHLYDRENHRLIITSTDCLDPDAFKLISAPPLVISTHFAYHKNDGAGIARKLQDLPEDAEVVTADKAPDSELRILINNAVAQPVFTLSSKESEQVSAWKLFQIILAADRLEWVFVNLPQLFNNGTISTRSILLHPASLLQLECHSLENRAGTTRGEHYTCSAESHMIKTNAATFHVECRYGTLAAKYPDGTAVKSTESIMSTQESDSTIPKNAESIVVYTDRQYE